MSNRLTVALKKSIIKEVIGDKYSSEAKRLEELFQDWRKRVLLHIIPLETRQKLDELPAGFVPDDVRITVTDSNRTFWDYIRYEGRCPYYIDNGSTILPASHDLAMEYGEIEKAKEANANAEAMAELELQSVLDTFTTVKALKAAWPEIATAVDKALGLSVKMVSNVPVVQVAHLNTKFNLPKEVEDA